MSVVPAPMIFRKKIPDLSSYVTSYLIMSTHPLQLLHWKYSCWLQTINKIYYICNCTHCSSYVWTMQTLMTLSSEYLLQHTLFTLSKLSVVIIMILYSSLIIC